MLLTFLALMTGLAASGVAVPARAVTPCAVEAPRFLSPAAARVSAHVVAHGRAMVRPAQPSLVAPRMMLPMAAPVLVPVLVGVERARE